MTGRHHFGDTIIYGRSLADRSLWNRTGFLRTAKMHKFLSPITLHAVADFAARDIGIWPGPFKTSTKKARKP